MKIIFVMGPACSGKSTYIKENFKDMEVVDLYDFQENCFSMDDIWKSYMDTKDALIERIKENKDVVLEHTLLKAKRRKIYIDAVKEVSNEPIEVILIKPSAEKILQRRNQREVFSSIEEVKGELEVLEIPTTDEGFSSVTIIEE